MEDGRAFMIRARLRVVVLRPEPRLAALVLAPVRAVVVPRDLGLGFGARRPREGFGARRRFLALVLVVVLDGFRRYWRTGHAGRLRLLRRLGRCGGVPTDGTRRQFLEVVPVHGRLALAAGPALVAVVEEGRSHVVLARTFGVVVRVEQLGASKVLALDLALGPLAFRLRFFSFFCASSMIRCLADPICGDGPLTMSNSALGCIHCSTTSSSPSVSPSSSKCTPSLASGVSACLPL